MRAVGTEVRAVGEAAAEPDPGRLVLRPVRDLAEADADPEVPALAGRQVLELLPQIVDRFVAGAGTLLTSGVLIVDYDGLVEAAAGQGLSPVAEERENDWIATRWERR